MMGDVIGPEVLVRKRAQKHLDKVNQLLKNTKTLREASYLLQLRIEHQETIKQTYIKGESNEHRDAHPDTNGGDSETQRDTISIKPEVVDIDGDSIISANDEDGGEASNRENKDGASDPDDLIIP